MNYLTKKGSKAQKISKQKEDDIIERCVNEKLEELKKKYNLNESFNTMIELDGKISVSGLYCKTFKVVYHKLSNSYHVKDKTLERHLKTEYKCE